MDDLLSTVRASAAMEDGAAGDGEEAIEVGRFAPYPVWMAMAVMARGAQLLFLLCCLWGMAALFDAMEKPFTIPLPPMWLWLVSVFLGCDGGRTAWTWKTSPVGDGIGNLLASQQCPACGQNVFDHTPPSGYAPPSQAQAIFPSRICTNCGHDLTLRTAS
jgi:hypothetical protein